MNRKRTDIIQKLLVPVLLALVFFIFASSAIKGKTNTTDEPSHLVRGIMLLKTGDYRLNQHHPILFNVINSVPAVLNPRLKTESLQSENWQQAKKDEMTINLIKINGGTNEFAENILYFPRLSMIFIVSIFLIWFYKFALETFGFIPALTATLSLVLSPTLLAHGALVTTDAPAMVTIFLGTWALYRYLFSKGKNSWLGVFILLSFIALITKYTAVFAAFLWIAILVHHEIFVMKKTVLKALLTPIIVILSWLLLLTGAYGFHFMTIREVGYNNPFFDAATLDFLSGVGKGFKPFNIPEFLTNIYYNVNFPFPQYIRGFMDNVIKHDIYGHKTYLLGEFSQSGWWYYFPVTFAVKETISFVLLTLGSILYMGIRLVKASMRGKLKYDPMYVFIAVPGFLFILSLFSSINIGIRHLLPLFPFIALGIGVMAGDIIRRSRAGARMLVAFLTISILSVVSQFPHYIEYFNEAVGGPQKGFTIIRDSNFDWGQNDGAALRYIEENENTSFNRDDLEDGGEWVVRVEDLFARPEIRSKDLTELYDEYTAGKIRPTASINHTFWIFSIEK
jgi:hypothetical protein